MTLAQVVRKRGFSAAAAVFSQRPAYCATDVVKRRQSKKKNSTWTRRKAAGRKQGRAREDSLGWCRAKEHTMNSLGWAERHGNRAGVGG